MLVRVVDDHGFATARRATEDHAQVVFHEQFDDETMADCVYGVDHLVRVVDDACVIRFPVVFFLSDLHLNVLPLELFVQHEID